MIKNYLKTAFRSIVKQRIFAIINIAGLSIGLASCFLIAMFIQDEFSYDDFHKNKENIYKLALERKYPAHSTNYALVPHSFSEIMNKDFPEVKKVARLFGNGNEILVTYEKENGEKVSFEESGMMLADSSFLEIFEFEMLKGDPSTALKNGTEILLTVSTAKKYFGDEDPMGKTLQTDFGTFTVAGVLADIPDNSHFDFDFLGSINLFPFFKQPNYFSFSTHMYLELEDNANPQVLESKFPQMVLDYAAPQLEQNLGISYEEYAAAGNGYRYFLQPLTDIHLDPTNIEAKIKPGGNLTYVYIFISIAVLILLIACINFMNLATARSAERAKEVGVRKSLGSDKKQLVFQFLTESILLSVISVLLSILFVFLVLPAFNQLAQKSLALDMTNVVLVVSLFSFAVLVGVLAGIYPAFVLSSYNTIQVMKGKMQHNTSGAWLRNGLVVFQFSISIVLITGTLVVLDQMRYIQNVGLGYNKDKVMVVERAFALNENLDSFIKELRRESFVVEAAGSGSVPGNFMFGAQFQLKGSADVLTVKGMTISDRYAETMGLGLKEGRWFGEAFNDSLNIILNESAVATLGIKDPVGTKLIQNNQNNEPVEFTVVGVVEDFHFQSLKDNISPFTLYSTENGAQGGVGFVSIRLNSDQLMSDVAKIEKKWAEQSNGQLFKFNFLDEQLQAQYAAEANSGKILAVFASLAIFIACVGLFGLSAYTASLKTKEIGVRKVLGASVGSIVYLLSLSFTRLVIIAFVIAAPAAYFAMDKWLGNFAYRVEISPWLFAISGAAALGIAWLTISFQSIKAAIVNPVKSLKDE